MRRLIAILSADVPDELVAFRDWLRRNRAHVVGISENWGCGCCVDAYDLVVDDAAEPMPSGASGTFRESAIRYGDARDVVIADLLGG